MSMRAWTQEGYGYHLFSGDNMEEIKDFLIKNENYSKEEIQLIRDAEDEWDLQEVTDDPVSWVIAAHINAKEGLACAFEGYDSCADIDHGQMIGISPKYPWEYRQEDRITREKANEILNKYAKILGIKEEPCEFTAEYHE